MSNMFRGTMLKKSPAANVAMAMSLEELDRHTYCPENVDDESWKHLCKIRREKIQSEERIQVLDGDIAETDQAVRERETAANDFGDALNDAVVTLDTWRKDKNYRLNNTEIVLAVDQGQLEVEPHKMSPNLQGATLITESVIVKLNQEIERLGESKLSAMTESKDFRIGTRLLLWEKERLSMEYEDLQAKWTEIQQTKLTKESRIALQAGEHINRPTLTQEYSNLDKAARAAEAYLKKRLDELTGIEETFSEMLKQKETERLELQDEVERLQDEVEMLRVEAENEEVEKLEAQEPERMLKIVQRNRLVKKIREQNDLLLSLQDQLDTYMFRSFPSLG